MIISLLVSGLGLQLGEVDAQAASPRYLAVKLTTTVVGNQVTASTAVTASQSSRVRYLKVCARRGSTNTDFGVSTSWVTLSTTATSWTSVPKTLPTGSYTYFACLQDSSGTWWNGPTQQLVIPAPSVASRPTATPTAPAGPARPTPTPTPSPPAPAPGTGPVGVPGSWKLAFADEFDGTSLDATKWDATEGRQMNKVTTRTANVSVGAGMVTLRIADAKQGAVITTELVDNVGPKGGFRLPLGGYAEARVFFPGDNTGCFNWPAWWISGPRWPTNGEHDVAEVLSGELTANYHSSSGAHNQGTVVGTWCGAWHVYGVHRKSSSADVYWDGKLVKSYGTDDRGAGHPLLLNVGAAGSTHSHYASDGNFVRADWVRAYLPR